MVTLSLQHSMKSKISIISDILNVGMYFLAFNVKWAEPGPTGLKPGVSKQMPDGG